MYKVKYASRVESFSTWKEASKFMKSCIDAGYIIRGVERVWSYK